MRVTVEKRARLFLLPILGFFFACGSGSGEVVLGGDASEQRELSSFASVINPNPQANDSNPSSSNDPFTALGLSSTASEEIETRPATRCASKIPGPPLGVACLHCAAPGARIQAQRLAELMASSCRENLATTMLVDGTFGEDRDFLGELVRIMSQHGSRVHLYLYLGNGPWQRRYRTVPNKGFGSKISPEEFRGRIQSDSSLQESYRERLRWLEPLIGYAQSLGAIVYLLPMLEDNLEYLSMFKSAHQLGWDAIPPPSHRRQLQQERK